MTVVDSSYSDSTHGGQSSWVCYLSPCCDKVPDVEFKERGKFVVAHSLEDAVVMVEKAWQQGHELLDTLRL